MTAVPIYKNQQITEEMLQEYQMVAAEFEKYAIVDSNGNSRRRLLYWDERGQIIGTYAAYPLQENITPDYRCFYTRRVDNSDSVLYNYPGKEIVTFDIDTSQLQTFKTFLSPGDRITITAIYKDEQDIEELNSTSFTSGNKTVTTYRSEQVFQDIVIADLLNSAGESILDIYADYNARSVVQQAVLDASAEFQESVRPSSLLVALTPEELTSYYMYLSKGDATFKMSLPQRVE